MSQQIAFGPVNRPRPDKQVLGQPCVLARANVELWRDAHVLVFERGGAAGGEGGEESFARKDPPEVVAHQDQCRVARQKTLPNW